MGVPAAGSPRGFNISLHCQRCGDPIVSPRDVTASIPIRPGAPLELRLNGLFAELTDELHRAGALPWYVPLPEGTRAEHCVTVEDEATGRARRYMVVDRKCYLEITAAEAAARAVAACARG